eukprot:825747-Amphidinium_carterae.2
MRRGRCSKLKTMSLVPVDAQLVHGLKVLRDLHSLLHPSLLGSLCFLKAFEIMHERHSETSPSALGQTASSASFGAISNGPHYSIGETSGLHS